jgi:hypothetical protein
VHVCLTRHSPKKLRNDSCNQLDSNFLAVLSSTIGAKRTLRPRYIPILSLLCCITCWFSSSRVLVLRVGLTCTSRSTLSPQPLGTISSVVCGMVRPGYASRARRLWQPPDVSPDCIRKTADDQPLIHEINRRLTSLLPPEDGFPAWVAECRERCTCAQGLV